MSQKSSIRSKQLGREMGVVCVGRLVPFWFKQTQTITEPSNYVDGKL